MENSETPVKRNLPKMTAEKIIKKTKKDSKAKAQAEPKKEKLQKLEQKASNEIDDLFAVKKTKETTIADLQKSGKKTDKRSCPPGDQPRTTAADEDDDDDFGDSRGLRKKKRPTTEEGYPIYTVKEMKIGLGGDTPDCPFDCECCF